MWFIVQTVLAYLNPLPAVYDFKTYPYTFDMPPNPATIELAAYGQAQQKIRAAEGYKLIVYYDTRGYLTVGVGHKVVSADGLKLGDKITDAQVSKFFANDIAKAFSAAKSQAAQLKKYTPEMIAALTSVNFQLGTGWTKEFISTWPALLAGNAKTAIANLNKSAWATQTPARVAEFVSTIKNQYTV